MEPKKTQSGQAWNISTAFFKIILFIPFLLLVFPAFDLLDQTLTVFPGGNICSRVYTVDDKFFNGNSEVKNFSCTGQGLKIDYCLRPGAEFPMIFIIFPLGTIEKPLDLSGIESVTIDVSQATVQNILLFFQTFIPGVSSPLIEKALTLRPNQYSLELSPGKKSYEIKIDQFVTELWWLAAINADPHNLPQEDYRRVINFTIQLNPYGSDYLLNKTEQINVEKVCFTKSLSTINQVLLFAITLFYTAFYILQLVLAIRDYRFKLPKVKPVQVTSYYEQDLSRIREFLQTHYLDPDVSVNDIYREYGIRKARVSELIYKEYQLTFRQIINKMKIEEAKRLLKQTEQKIIDIAVALGFKNTTYFNRIFKKYTGLTPSEFKEQI